MHATQYGGVFLGFGLLLTILMGCQPSEKEASSGAAHPKSGKVELAIETGNKAMTQKDWSKAIESFTLAIQAQPNRSDSYFRRGVAFFARGRDHYDRARVTAELQNKPESAIEDAQLADDSFQHALNDWKKALELDPNSASPHYMIGNVQMLQGDWDAACINFTKAIEIDPKDAASYQRRGEIYKHLGDTIRSDSDLTRAAELGYQPYVPPARSESDSELQTSQPSPAENASSKNSKSENTQNENTR